MNTFDLYNVSTLITFLTTSGQDKNIDLANNRLSPSRSYCHSTLCSNSSIQLLLLSFKFNHRSHYKGDSTGNTHLFNLPEEVYGEFDVFLGAAHLLVEGGPLAVELRQVAPDFPRVPWGHHALGRAHEGLNALLEQLGEKGGVGLLRWRGDTSIN